MKKIIDDFQIDERFHSIGVKAIVCAIIKGLNNTIPPHNGIEEKITSISNHILSMSEKDLESNQVLCGYKQSIKNINRSNKKFPPSAETLIGIIKRTGTFPRINNIVDIYNISTLESFLALGVHDLDKVNGSIQFRFSPGGEKFVAIGGSEKTTSPDDFVYSDSEKILAWLDTRDSDLAKITSNTKNIIVIAQGNCNTSVDYRINTLKTLCDRIISVSGGNYYISVKNVPTNCCIQ